MQTPFLVMGRGGEKLPAFLKLYVHCVVFTSVMLCSKTLVCISSEVLCNSRGGPNVHLLAEI